METAPGLLCGGGAQGSPLLCASAFGFVARVNIEAYIKSAARMHTLITAPPPSWTPAGRGYRVVEWC